MDISVILCTYNRGQSLSHALASVTASVLPEGVIWEVLVVDNNSTDKTKSVVEGVCRQNPERIRYIFEPKPGKSNALNTGIHLASGKVLAFVDDDVIVDPNWLYNLTANLYTGTWAGAGGRILPQWNSPPPRWLPLQDRYGLAPLAMFDIGLEAGPLAEPPFGTNMAYQKSMFEKYGGFRTDLGPRPGSEIRNEDTEFGQRLLSAGEHLLYEPSAVVHHSVSPNRTRKGYFLTWWFDKARADLREFGVPADTSWSVAGIPLYFFRRLARWTVQWMIAVEPSRRFGAKLKVWGRIGEITECYRMARDAQSGKRENNPS